MSIQQFSVGDGFHLQFEPPMKIDPGLYETIAERSTVFTLAVDELKWSTHSKVK